MPDKPSVPIRLIALDLDGTLLRSDHSIGPRSLEALHAAHAKGIEIVLASGRMTPAMERTAKALGLDVCLISYNGAAVCGRLADGRERLFHRPLGADIASEVYTYASERGLQINYYLDDVIHSEDDARLRPYMELYRERTGSPFYLVESLKGFVHREPTKVLLVLEPSRREEVAVHWKARLGARADVVRTEQEYLEFLAPGADKGSAVAFLGQKLGIDAAAIMTMGNGENDIPMLQRAGWSVAVANACEPCKAAAKAVTQNDHENDAVAEAIERWVL
jgi:Cof subfamily protein (haloacid dehalogenase superfamily)